MVQLLQQLRVVMYCAFEDFGLLLRCGPVLFLDCFGETGKFQMCVSESGAVEDVFEPWTSGDAIGVEPVAFDLHHAVIQGGGELGIEGAGGEFLFE